LPGDRSGGHTIHYFFPLNYFMKSYLLILGLAESIAMTACLKKPSYEPLPYHPKPTLEISTNYIRITDQAGWYELDTGRTQLTFFNFYNTPSLADTLVPSMDYQNDYYSCSYGIWKIRYIGTVPLINPDSLQLRSMGGGEFQQQVLTLSLPKPLWGKPIFELFHPPTNTVYARYTAGTNGAKIILVFSGPRNAIFDTLASSIILTQFQYKLKTDILDKFLFTHS
jgi:hypothetical protein